ncbi:hypothetical protein QN362_16475 [Actimicrobium sp. CCC2.4]|uniref:hypothetical protein n=1 Tax=Actimicrobium sp. CCC2.4 TaxID=3048606 RepID=UPI002AC9EDB8|nr:hypothetical protein [Actimicrobium sp. CCC2.4]MEB0136932.1 hypothetical protein [Actimicrobium sp. CCC2.4]WPX34237.1 hypothetical protein RHM62_02325 [Actimicrobium sp. CCC2.4]
MDHVLGRDLTRYTVVLADFHAKGIGVVNDDGELVGLELQRFRQRYDFRGMACSDEKHQNSCTNEVKGDEHICKQEANYCGEYSGR